MKKKKDETEERAKKVLFWMLFGFIYFLPGIICSLVAGTKAENWRSGDLEMFWFLALLLGCPIFYAAVLSIFSLPCWVLTGESLWKKVFDFLGWNG